MALVLALRPGESFYVDQARFTVIDIKSDREATLKRASDGQEFNLVESRSQEIAPSTRVSVGYRSQLELTRLAIEAPRSVYISRMEDQQCSR